MTYVKNFIIATLVITLTSCDTPGSIEVQNDFPLKAQVKISYQNKTYEPYTIDIEPLRKAEIILGFGARWNEQFTYSYKDEVVDTISVKLGQIEYYCATTKCKSDLFTKANKSSSKKLIIVVDANLIKNSFTKS
ncbi:hypothetical protein AAU57_01520 [Nonlabens sp. YIK11]|uniref:hypothetical protein n=1 Tax=Nonlabens sp. YIK11 TaxID=1453349 RepID=UPI0006DC209B|nr:hypothetical protein [Nonlabens sp. YIK11]KQC32146.1 hypothetical protein AAU57_01520 [Nonlabens sp. YIK11]